MRVATVEEFSSNPVGRYVGGQTFVHFCLEAGLWGVLLWGRPSEPDALALGRTLVLELAPPAKPHASLIDASRLEGGDEGAFGALQRYVAKYGERLEQWVTKVALLRPPGMRGALVAGAYEVMPKPYPVAVFDEVAPALDWLGAGRAAAAFAELTRVALGTSPLRGALRAWLELHLEGATVGQAAHAVGLSERSLQRKLAEAGSSFQDELADARVRAAQRRMLDGDAALTTIAHEVGCSSLQHFNAMFKRRTGMAPGAWRESQRAR